jgi:hypothetical protein
MDLIRDSNGKLPAYAWPGGYPIVYVSSEGFEYCPDCANQEDADPKILDYAIHWEGEPIICDGCGKEIESAYGVPEENENES